MLLTFMLGFYTIADIFAYVFFVVVAVMIPHTNDNNIVMIVKMVIMTITTFNMLIMNAIY